MATNKKLTVIGSRYFHDRQTITYGAPPAEFNGDKLRNTFGYPMLVDEIRFEVAMQGGAGGSDQQLIPVSGVGLSARIAVNQHKLNNTMTPIALMCRPNDRVKSRFIAGTAEGVAGLLTAGTVEVGAMTWKLDRPLTLMPNESLAVEVQFPPLNPAIPAPVTTYYVTVAGMGRLVTEAPARRWIPFVSAWVPSYLQASAVDVVPVIRRSVAADLYNPFGRRLFVKDVLGLGTYYSTSQSVGLLTSAVQNIVDTPFLGFGMEGCATSIVMAGKMGGAAPVNVGARDPMPFFHLFIPQTRSWRWNAVLEPRSFLTAHQSLAGWNAMAGAAGGGGADPTTIYARFAMALIGYGQADD